jgi:cytochrome c-type biogenesis protein CcmH
LVLAVLLLPMASAWAVVETRHFDNELERVRFESLAAELRCPKCQNQNLLDSDAPIALDLRNVLHEQLRDGRTDDEIMRYMTDRYGEFVRYRPDWHGPALLIWLLPLFLLMLAAWVVWRQVRRASVGEGA